MKRTVKNPSMQMRNAFICSLVCASLTVKGAGHSRRVGTKQLGSVTLGIFLVLLCVNTLPSKPESYYTFIFHTLPGTKKTHTRDSSVDGVNS